MLGVTFSFSILVICLVEISAISARFSCVQSLLARSTRIFLAILRIALENNIQMQNLIDKLYIAKYIQ